MSTTAAQPIESNYILMRREISNGPRIQSKVIQLESKSAEAKENKIATVQPTDTLINQQVLNVTTPPAEMTSRLNLLDLDDECLVRIIKYLRYKDVVFFARSSRRAKTIAKRHIHLLFVQNIYRPLERIERDLQYIIRTLRR